MPTDDHLVRLLLDYRLAQASPDPWYEVSAGRMSADEAARLMGEVEPPELIEASRQLFVPPSPRALGQRREELVRRFCVGGGSVAVASHGRWWVPVMAIAAALLLCVWLVRDRAEVEGASFVADYRLEPLRSWEPMRGSDDGPTEPRAPRTYRTDGSIALRLRPRVAQDGTVGATVFGRDEDGETRRLLMRTRDLGEGVLELDAPSTSAAGLHPGWWTLIVVVGPVDSLPPSPPNENEPSSDYERIEHVIRIVPPNEPQ